MLILERDKGETIIIGDEIKVTVLKVKGSQVRFGIDAPEDISISRTDEPLNSARGQDTHSNRQKRCKSA